MNKEAPDPAEAVALKASRELPCPHCRGRSFTAFDRDLPGGGYAKTLDRVRCLDCKAELPADLTRVSEAAEGMREALKRLGSSETMTTSFMRRNNNEGLELHARLTFARQALKDHANVK